MKHFHLALGTLPDWFGGVSLLLAFVIFFRDRRERARTQADLVGIWFDRPEWTPGAAPTITVELHIRNASQLPVRINEIAFTVTPTWAGVPHGPNQLRSQRATPIISRRSLPTPLPPGRDEVIALSYEPVNSAGGVGLGQVDCGVTEAQIVDNAGRTWLVRAGRRAARPYSQLYFRQRRLVEQLRRLRRRIGGRDQPG